MTTTYSPKPGTTAHQILTFILEHPKRRFISSDICGALAISDHESANRALVQLVKHGLVKAWQSNGLNEEHGFVYNKSHKFYSSPEFNEMAVLGEMWRKNRQAEKAPIPPVVEAAKETQAVITKAKEPVIGEIITGRKRPEQMLAVAKRMKYDLDSMKLEDCIFIGPNDKKTLTRAYSVISNFKKKNTEKKFSIERSQNGVYIWRDA